MVTVKKFKSGYLKKLITIKYSKRFQNAKIQPPKTFSQNSYIKSYNEYKRIYNESVKDKDQFWSKVSERIDWYKPWETVKKYDFHEGKIEWFLNGKLNASYNCIDRHVENGFGDSLAIIWEGNDPNQSRKFTYSELLKEVSFFANALKSLGVKKGDRVCLYMQMVPELSISNICMCKNRGSALSSIWSILK